MLAKSGLVVVLGGSFLLALLLATGHSGFATRVAGLFFFVLTTLVILSLVHHENH